jgi:hypothetical protein
MQKQQGPTTGATCYVVILSQSARRENRPIFALPPKRETVQNTKKKEPILEIDESATPIVSAKAGYIGLRTLLLSTSQRTVIILPSLVTRSAPTKNG